MHSYPNTFVVDLNPDYGLIEVSGPDNAAFLQGQLTADIRTITPTHHSLAAYCNPKGRIRALFRIFLVEDRYYLQAPLLLIPSAMASLQKTAKFSKVTLTDVSQIWHRYGIALDHSTQLSNLHAHLETIDNLILLPIAENPPRFEILGTTIAIEHLWKMLQTQYRIGDFNDWLLLDITNGIPEIWPETTELFLPHYLNLPQLGAVSFNKGCYCGQEIIARMEYRANLKRVIKHVTQQPLQTLPKPGTPFLDPETQQEKGVIISVAQSSDDTVELLVEHSL